MAETMRVALANPGEDAKIVEVEKGYQSIQTLVGGYFDVVSLDGNLTLWVNDEGLCDGLPWNRMIGPQRPIAGPMVITATEQTSEGNESRGLTPREQNAALRWLNRIPRLEPTPSSIEEFEAKSGEPAMRIAFQDETGAMVECWNSRDGNVEKK